MKKKITLRTGSLKEAAQEFIDVWHRIEQGATPQTSIEKISFKDPSLLFKTLTPKRFEILNYLHGYGEMTIRALTKALERDYSNVHQDLQILYRLGLVLKSEKNKYYVPWDVIVTEIPLTVIHKPNRSRRSHHSNPRRAHG